DDVFKPKAGTKIDMTVGRAEPANIGLHLLRKRKIEVVAPRVTKVACEIRRKRAVGSCPANKIRIARHTEDWKYGARFIYRSETHLPDVAANFLFGLWSPERNMQQPQAGCVVDQHSCLAHVWRRIHATIAFDQNANRLGSIVQPLQGRGLR